MLGDRIYDELLWTLKESLEELDHLRMADPNNEKILDLRRALRDKIRQIEEQTELRRAA